MFKKIYLFSLFIAFSSCNKTQTIITPNDKAGKLTGRYKLEIENTKSFILDSVTAPKPVYIQLYIDSKNERHLTFINTFNNSIYHYNYNSLEYEKKTTYSKTGANSIASPKAYYITNNDSIFVYNVASTELVLTDAENNIKKRISLRGEEMFPNWYDYYPQYYFLTINPIISLNSELILPGQYFFSIPNDKIKTFKFTSRVNKDNGKVKFSHSYPESIYGKEYNWEGGVMTGVFADLHSDGKKIVYSFPTDHNVYITDLNGEKYNKVYAGSNYANSINSISKKIKNTKNEDIFLHQAQQDIYTAIKYDKYRKLYYRFMLRSIPNATSKIRIEKKEISIIIMDENFNYMGETIIGNGEEWHWKNTFITSEGLNIEYTGKKIDESKLTFKVFTVKRI